MLLGVFKPRDYASRLGTVPIFLFYTLAIYHPFEPISGYLVQLQDSCAEYSLSLPIYEVLQSRFTSNMMHLPMHVNTIATTKSVRVAQALWLRSRRMRHSLCLTPPR